MSILNSPTPAEMRAQCRCGVFTGATAGYADGYVQTNLVILPQEFAFDFLLFAMRNPKSCPLIEVLEAGQTESSLAKNSDIRTDLPGYRVFRDGQLVEEVKDICALWQQDLVSFLIGCSFSFEAALLRSGIALRHVSNRCNVSMYRTNIPCQSAGRMHGNLVVSMRPIKASDVAQAVEISARYPKVHGAPIHIGAPSILGIADLSLPDYGDPTMILPEELPVFWACGVTPQAVAIASRLPFCITHSPGKMFITDALAD